MTPPTDPPLEPPPRKAHLRRGIRNMRRAYRTIFVFVILMFGGWAVLDGFRWYDLTFHVRSAEGKITKKHAGPQYRLEYTFTTEDAAQVNAEVAVAAPVYEKSAENQPAPIVYLPTNPRVDHWLFDNDAARTNVRYLALGHGVAALLALAILRLVEGPLGRELRLARQGVAALGQVVTVGKPRGRRGVVKITYSFPTAAGATIQGACNLPRRFPAHTLEPGTPITVLYDSKKPRIHKPRLALDSVEFGELGKKKTPDA